MATRAVATTAALALVAALIVGCAGGRGVTIPPGSDDLPVCTRVLDAERLADIPAGDCDLRGSSANSPDGTIVTVPPVGAVFSHSDARDVDQEYRINNWGVPGIAMTLVRRGAVVGTWAMSPEAESLERQAIELDGLRSP
jgi:hypothetical protein